MDFYRMYRFIGRNKQNLFFTWQIAGRNYQLKAILNFQNTSSSKNDSSSQDNQQHLVATH